MKNFFAFLFLIGALLIGTQSFAQRGHSRGKSHSSYHSGHYKNGQGSSHKGGHYRNSSTNNHYRKRH